jgi:hypothetical protein
MPKLTDSQLAEIDREIAALQKEYDDCDCQYECTACFGNLDDIKTLKRQREYLVMDMGETV